MPVLILALALLVLLGHAALWIGFVNRVHAMGAPRWLVKASSLIGYGILAFAPIIAALVWLRSQESLFDWLTTVYAGPLRFYAIVCWILAAVATALWVHRTWFTRLPDVVRQLNRSTFDVEAALGHKPLHGTAAKLLSLVPGNQVLKISVDELHCKIKRLPQELDGLSIVHLSDLHITGRLGIDFFRAAVQKANELQPDLIAITGDFIDDFELLDWIPDALGKLAAPLGVHFVLGNHDGFTHEPVRLRETLISIGFNDLGSCWRSLDARGANIILAGNELPWFVPAADMGYCPPRSPATPQLRILLSHSPDQFRWASRWDFDLMLAGHTHGGQIRLPLVGPILAPSWHGVKYASGTFFKSPTLMHVSRGLSGEAPIRLNCPPEITQIVLHLPEKMQAN
jgi:predicted MPP superfamily phosphohydrolase